MKIDELDQIEDQINTLNAEKAALKEKKETERYKQQRDTILKSHPFSKKLRAVLIEALTRDLTVAEYHLLKTANDMPEQTAEDYDAELQGKFKAAQHIDPAVRIADVDKLVNSVVNHEKRNDFAEVKPQIDLGAIVKSAILIAHCLKAARTKICKTLKLLHSS